jgi:hypothetical protein
MSPSVIIVRGVAGMLNFNFLELAGDRVDRQQNLATLLLGYGDLQPDRRHYFHVEAAAVVIGSKLEELRFMICGDITGADILYSLNLDGHLDAGGHHSSTHYFYVERRPDPRKSFDKLLGTPFTPLHEIERTVRQQRQLFIRLIRSRPLHPLRRRGSRLDGVPNALQLRERVSHLQRQQFCTLSPIHLVDEKVLDQPQEELPVLGGQLHQVLQESQGPLLHDGETLPGEIGVQQGSEVDQVGEGGPLQEGTDGGNHRLLPGPAVVTGSEEATRFHHHTARDGPQV